MPALVAWVGIMRCPASSNSNPVSKWSDLLRTMVRWDHWASDFCRTDSNSALPAVRVELNPQALFKYGIGLEDVRAALASANANSPKGALEDGDLHYQIYTNDQASHAADYVPLVVAFRNGAAVRLSDVGEVKDSVEDLRN